MFYDTYVNLCKSVGKTPSAVAVEIGIGKSNVTYWKNGRNCPSDITLAKIADYFGVTVSALKGVGKKENPGTKSVEGLSPVTRELMDMVHAATEEEQRDMLEMLRIYKRKK